jgi:hypothetical protein
MHNITIIIAFMLLKIKCHRNWSAVLCFCSVLITSLCSGRLYAQATSSFYINITSQPVNLTYSTASDFETAKNVDKAFQFTLAAKNSDYTFYVRMERSGGAGPSQLPLNLFYVQFDSSSPAKSVPVSPFYLTSTDQRIFTDTIKGNQTDTYLFDFGHSALGYAYSPGQYIMLVTFTLTSP